MKNFWTNCLEVIFLTINRFVLLWKYVRTTINFDTKPDYKLRFKQEYKLQIMNDTCLSYLCQIKDERRNER